MFNTETKAQKWAVDVQLEYNDIGPFYRLEKQIGVQKIVNNHTFRLAPIFQLYTTEARNSPDAIQFTGISASYKLGCKTPRPYLNFFFKYDMTFQSFENDWTASQFDFKSGRYEDYDYESEEFFSAQTLGYGFSVNLWKGLYIQQAISAGVRISKIKGETETSGAPENEPYDFRGYDDIGFIWKASLTLGYRF